MDSLDMEADCHAQVSAKREDKNVEAARRRRL